MRLALALALPLSCLWAAGCSGLGSHDIELTISASSVLKDDALASVRSLEIGAGDGTHGSSTMEPLSRPLSRSERVTLHTTSDKGMLGVGVIAYDASGNIVALGNNSIMLDGKGPKSLAVTLKAPTASDNQLVHVTPATYTIFTGQTIALAADSTVTWSVQEGAAGGSVDDSGVFTAPSTAGTYHVVATSTDYFGHTGTATLDVRSSGIAPYVGQLGGAGTHDGPPGVGRLVSPTSITIVGSALYFTTQDKLVRALDLKSGNLTTIAGAIDAPAPVDGTGPTAHFGDMHGIVSDGLGNLYIADGSNAAIRKVAITTGKVTTFAGTLGSAGFTDGAPGTARIGFIYGLAFDGAGSLYFSDSNCRIGKVDLATQTVTTVVGHTPANPSMCSVVDGTGSSAGIEPAPIVWDGAGHLFIVSTNVRRVDVTAGSVTTIAMPGALLGAPAWDGHDIWTFNNGMYKIAPTGMVTPVKDPTFPTAVLYVGAFQGAFASDGTMYVATNEVIGTLDPTTMDKVRLVAGTPSTQDYNFFPGNSTFGDRTQTRLRFVTAFTVAPDGTFYGRADYLFKIDPSSTTLDKLTTGSLNDSSMTSMVADSSGNLYAGGFDNVIRRFSLADGSVAVVAGGASGYKEGTGAAAGFSQIADLVLDGAGNAYVADVYTSAIRKIVLASGQTSLFAGTPMTQGFADGTGSAAQFNQPRGLAYDGAGTLYVADSNNARIRKITVPGAVVTTIAGSGMFGASDGAAMSASFSNPTSVVRDVSKQNLIIADTFNNTLRKLSLAGGTVSTVAGTLGQSWDQVGALPGTLNQPQMLRLSPSGDVLVLTPREASILQIRLP